MHGVDAHVSCNPDGLSGPLVLRTELFIRVWFEFLSIVELRSNVFARKHGAVAGYSTTWMVSETIVSDVIHKGAQ